MQDSVVLAVWLHPISISPSDEYTMRCASLPPSSGNGNRAGKPEQPSQGSASPGYLGRVRRTQRVSHDLWNQSQGCQIAPAYAVKLLVPNPPLDSVRQKTISERQPKPNP